MLQILFITEYLYPQINGIAVRCENYIKELQNKGHIVYIAGPNNSNTSDIKLYTIKNILNKDNRFCFPTIKLYKFLISNKIDVVHIFFPPMFAYNSIFLILNKLNIPIVSSYEVSLSYANNYFGKKGDIIKFIYKKIWKDISKKSTINLSPSKYTDFYNVLKNNVDICPTGIDLQIFNSNNINIKYKSTSRILIYIGRLAPEKNCEQMINYFKLLSNDYKLLIIGDGPSRKELEKLADDCKRIKFIGYVKHNELNNYYKNCQAFITFSLSETYGFTLLESLATSTPIIYPRCNVFDDLYRKEFSQTSFDINNFESFKKAIEYTYDNSKLNKKCYKYAKQNTWEYATEKLLSIYNDAINIKNNI